MGMPRLRQAYTPHPVVDQSAAHLRAYIEGNDAVSGRPFMQEVLDGLTSPLEDADLQGLSFERTTPRLVEPDTEDDLQRLFEENRWTDMLPIVLPTEARVEAMLKGTSHRPDEIVGRLRPTVFREAWEFTVEKVAVNAVMAGARPEYFPVILALAASGITARSSSTTSFATISIINGPIRNEIAMNSGIGVMGPYNHANATIGRAYGLLSQNLQGGSVPNETYMGSQGNWYAYTAVIPGGGGAQSLAAVARAARLQADRQRRQHLLRRMVHACRLRSARHVAGEDAPRPGRGRAVQPAALRDGSDRGARVRRSRLRHQGKADCLVCRQRAADRARVLGQSIDSAVAPARPSLASSRMRRVSRPHPDEVIKIYEPSDINIVVAGGETQGAWKMISGALGRPSRSTRGGDGRGSGAGAMSQQTTVHDPRGYPPKVVGKRLAPRLSTLDGKTIYLVDCLFDNTDVFMEQLRQWFVERLPAVNVRIDPAEGNVVRRCRDAASDRRRRRRRDSRRRSLKHL